MKLNHMKIGFVFFILTGLCGCTQTHTYSADPVYARVVDADTGRPLEGVVVVAYWELYQGSITGDGMPCGAANVEEAVTDKDGWFHIPGWGPVKGDCGIMRNGNPFVYFFKSDYVYLRKAGGIGFDTNKPVSIAQVDWNGQTIKLQKFQNLDLLANNAYSYAANFGAMGVDLGMFIADMPSECNWKKLPHLLRAIALQTKAFHAAGNQLLGLDGQLIINDQYFQEIAPQCGSPKAFIEGLLK